MSQDSPQPRSIWPDRCLLLLLALLLIPLEWVATNFAFHTLSEIGQLLYFLALASNGLILLVGARYPRAATIAMILLGLAILPYQAYLGDRLRRVEQEAARIVTHCYEHRLTEGRYPANLRGYRFEDPATSPFLYYERGEDAFRLAYHIGTVTTWHWYYSQEGWFYRPN